MSDELKYDGWPPNAWTKRREWQAAAENAARALAECIEQRAVLVQQSEELRDVIERMRAINEQQAIALIANDVELRYLRAAVPTEPTGEQR